MVTKPIATDQKSRLFMRPPRVSALGVLFCANEAQSIGGILYVAYRTCARVSPVESWPRSGYQSFTKLTRDTGEGMFGRWRLS
jgi:hypothetical protein